MFSWRCSGVTVLAALELTAGEYDGRPMGAVGGADGMETAGPAFDEGAGWLSNRCFKNRETPSTNKANNKSAKTNFGLINMAHHKQKSRTGKTLSLGAQG